MMSRITIFWLVALAGMVVMTVTVSLEVDRANNRIDAISIRKSAVEERIALLDASYQLLVSPGQLRPIVDKHLKLQEIRGDQLIAIDQLPTRIPTPTARKPEPKAPPQQYGQNETPTPTQRPSAAPPLPSAPANPPWLEAQGRAGLQPVTLKSSQRRPK